jgi:hypothetical protein
MTLQPTIPMTLQPTIPMTLQPTIPMTLQPTIPMTLQPIVRPPLTPTVKPPVWPNVRLPLTPTFPPTSVQLIDGTSLSPEVNTEKPFISLTQQPNAVPTDNSETKNGWIKPSWWEEYRKKFSKRQLKKCVWLYGIVPTPGSICPRKGNGGKYMCMLGEKTCVGISSPLPEFPDITGISLGNNHPEMRCTCGEDRQWECDDWNVCTR